MKLILNISLLLLLFISCDRNSGNKDIMKGQIYWEQGDYINAKKSFKRALEQDNLQYDRKELLTILGNVYNELDLFDSSIIYHQKALAIDSNYINALVNLGIVYRLTAEFDLAEQCYTKAAKVNPNDPELLSSLGVLYIFQDKVDLAIEKFEKAIALSPRLASAHANYALALAMSGKFEAADKAVKKAVALGYKNGGKIKERIRNLKAIEE